MVIIWGLLSAITWGTSNFLASGVTQREGSLRVLFYLQIIGAGVAAATLLSTGPAPWSSVFSISGLQIVILAFAASLSSIMLLRALAIGPLLIVAPILGSFAAVTVVLSIISGERLSLTQTVGVIVTLSGVILATVSADGDSGDSQSAGPRRWMSIGIVFAIGAALLNGFAVWLLRFVVPVLGSPMTAFLMRSAIAIIVLFYLAVTRTSLALTSSGSLKLLVPMGILDTASLIFLGIGLATGLTSIVSVLASLFSVVTMLLSYVILKERISRIQQLGAFLTLVGVAVVSI